MEDKLLYVRLILCRVIYIRELLTFFLKLERSKATLRNVRILEAIH
jgi:hypothetical protein